MIMRIRKNFLTLIGILKRKEMLSVNKGRKMRIMYLGGRMVKNRVKNPKVIPSTGKSITVSIYDFPLKPGVC
jgi:hypothetical protein